MSDVSRNTASSICTIVDSKNVSTGYSFLIICLGIGGYCLYYWFDVKGWTQSAGSTVLAICCVFMGLATLIWIFMIKVHSKGYIIDVENDTFEFPKGFKRYHVRLSEIHEINIYEDTSVDTDNKGRVRTTRYKMLDVNGTFGLHSLSFGSDDKRNELYSALARIIKMH